MCMSPTYTGLLENSGERPFRDSDDGPARGVAIPEVIGAILRGIPRQGKRIQNQFQVLGDRQIHRLAALEGSQPNAPSVWVPGDGLLLKRADVRDAERSVPKQHDHRSRAEPPVTRATGVLLAASNLLRCRQYSTLLLRRIGHHFVRLQVSGSF